MVDVLFENDEVAAWGPSGTLDIQLDIGPTGTRGSKIFIGSGDPNSKPLSFFSNDLKINDIYINNAIGSEFSYMYQYINKLGGSEWVEVLKINPAIYSLIETVDFTSGVGSIEIDIANIVQNSGSPLTADSFSVQFSVGNDEIVSAVITQIAITGVTNDKLTITFKGIKYDGSSWVNLNSESVTIHAIITAVAVI